MYTLTSKYLQSELAAASIMLTTIILYNHHDLDLGSYNFDNLIEIINNIFDFHLKFKISKCNLNRKFYLALIPSKLDLN